MTLNAATTKSPEQSALESGYVPDDNGNVVSPFGTPMKPFLPNKHVPLRAVKFNCIEQAEDGTRTKRPVTVYLHRLLWTHKTGEILTSSERIVFKDGDKNNLTIDNLAKEIMVSSDSFAVYDIAK